MRTIEWSNAIKRDYRHVKANPRHTNDVDNLLEAVLDLLVEDTLLPASCRDHVLAGDWKNHRECHIKPDLLLIYQKAGTDLLRLVRLGSHSELFGR